ncbi:hypothetical protein QLH32_17630 [Acinetobacter corruptisaponis]|uniref:Uncharacterized protein n=1 Tax=Acinetobacter corruptisaponis TaxID=3045147 RepID=A0ABY8S7Z8_9GAMM|nr:hypothetical protein [Acinetobacter sp. KCTC 92772]WHP05799.1 hypothetical protein QLH32_17630 [Acinetobacter sp. KCTC 92772]
MKSLYDDKLLCVQQMAERVTPDEFKAFHALVVQSIQDGLSYEQFAVNLMDKGVHGLLSHVDRAHP